MHRVHVAHKVRSLARFQSHCACIVLKLGRGQWKWRSQAHLGNAHEEDIADALDRSDGPYFAGPKPGGKGHEGPPSPHHREGYCSYRRPRTPQHLLPGTSQHDTTARACLPTATDFVTAAEWRTA